MVCNCTPSLRSLAIAKQFFPTIATTALPLYSKICITTTMSINPLFNHTINHCAKQKTVGNWKTNLRRNTYRHREIRVYRVKLCEFSYRRRNLSRKKEQIVKVDGGLDENLDNIFVFLMGLAIIGLSDDLTYLSLSFLAK